MYKGLTNVRNEILLVGNGQNELKVTLLMIFEGFILLYIYILVCDFFCFHYQAQRKVL